MPTSTMSPDEATLRAELAQKVTLLRRAMNRIPDPEALGPEDTLQAATTLVDANHLAISARSITAELEQLENLTAEGAQLAASARMALAMIHETMALLCAEFDSRLAA